MRTSSFAWPGSLLIPKAEPDPPVSTGPALTVILSCCPDRVAPLGCWLSFQAPRELRAGVMRLALHRRCSQHLPKIGLESKDLPWGAVGRCVSALVGHRPLRAWPQDGFRLVQEISVRRKPGFLETTGGSSRSQEYYPPGQVNGRSWP